MTAELLGLIIGIASAAIGLAAAYFGLRGAVKADHADIVAVLVEIKHDTKATRRWHEEHGEEQLKALHTMHNVRDSDNVPVWYVRRSLENKIKDMGDAIVQLAESNQQIHAVMLKLLERLDQ